MSVLLPLFERMMDGGPSVLRPVAAKLYTLALEDGGARSLRAPEPFTDPWTGNVDMGRALTQGVLHDRTGAPYTLNVATIESDVAGQPAAFVTALHGFSWLRDLRAFGGDSARATARGMLQIWLSAHKTVTPELWAPELVGARLYHLLASYDWLSLPHDDTLSVAIRASLVTQLAHLQRTLWPSTLSEMPLPRAVETILGAIAGLVLVQPDEEALRDTLHLLDTVLGAGLHVDGMVKSRAPVELYDTLCALICVRTLLSKWRVTPSVRVSHALTQGIAALRMFMMADGFAAHMQGARSDSMPAFETLLQLSGQKNGYKATRAIAGLDASGFKLATQSRAWVLVDAGTGGAHVSPAAFEFGAGRHRIVTNCGVAGTETDWGDLLRSAAAHSCLVLDGRDPDLRAPATATLTHQAKIEGVEVIAQHDGYAASFGVTHRRHVLLSRDGATLRGQDSVLRDGPVHGLNVRVPYAVRFHLHPMVQASLVREGQSVLLKLPNGQGWAFTQHGAADIRLEQSVWAGASGRPRKTQQIVLTGHLSDAGASIGWQFAVVG